MKSSRFKWSFRANASKQHKLVGMILREDSLWSGYSSYQEYPVNRVNSKYHSSKEHFDWYVTELKLVIEVHGRQHFEPVAFGKEDSLMTVERFKEQQKRDVRKRQAALEAGASYIMIRYDENVTSDLIYKKYMETLHENEEVIQSVESGQEGSSKSFSKADTKFQWGERYQRLKAQRDNSDYVKERHERARKYRRERYRRLSEFKKKLGEN